MEQSAFQPNMVLYGINVPVCTICLVTKPEFTIGYSSDNDAVLQFSREISRHHAKITHKNDAYEIEDLGSTNKTFLNGETMTPNRPQKLQHGDRIQFASFIFEVKVVNL